MGLDKLHVRRCGPKYSLVPHVSALQNITWSSQIMSAHKRFCTTPITLCPPAPNTTMLRKG